MDYGPLVKEEIDAGRELIRRLDRYRPIKAAFWLRESDDPHRYLYLASERSDAHPDDLSYPEVSPIVREMQSPDIDPFRIKVVAADHPLARDAMEITEKYPTSTGRRMGGSRFGNLFAEDVYIYPLPLPAVVV